MNLLAGGNRTLFAGMRCLCGCVIAGALASQLFAQEKVDGVSERAALIIGVDQYDHLPANAQLQVAVKDAELLAETLRTLPIPFKVTLITNGNREEIATAMDQFVETAKGAECALVYFAGHGIEFHGENYLLLRDTEIKASGNESVQRMKDRLYYKTLALRKAISDLDETGALLKLVILDSCRDNPLELETENGTRSLMGAKKGLGRVTAPSGMLISYSADAGQQANDGLFTSVLAKNIQIPGKNLMEVFARTRTEVRERAKLLSDENKGVMHEPAEYSKLNPEGLNFAFVSEARNPADGDSSTVAVTPAPTIMMPSKASEMKEEKLLEAKIQLAEVTAKIETERARWQEAENTIVTLTNNRRTPVREGSPQYHTCVAALEVIQEVNSLAPDLKAEKNRLDAIVEALGD